MSSLYSELRPERRVTTLAAAKLAGCDLVQYKYNAQGVRIVVSRGQVRVQDARDEELYSFTVEDDRACCQLIGSYFAPPRYATQHLIAFDCVEVGQQPADHTRIEWTDIRQWSYRDRFAMMKQQVSLLQSSQLTLVENFKIDRAQELWDRHDFFERACGLVFRSSKSPFKQEILYVPKYKEVPRGLE